MINIRHQANQMTSVINPNHKAWLITPLGLSTDEAGNRVPVYRETEIECQLQQASVSDIPTNNGMRNDGEYMVCYINGRIDTVSTINQTSGHMLRINLNSSSVSDWLVVSTPEIWRNWTRVVVCRQS